MRDEGDTCLINLCGCLLEIDDSPKVLDYLQELLDHAREKHLPRVEAAALNLLAKASRRSNKPEEAESHSLQAIQIWQRLGSIEKMAMNIANLGNAYKDLGKLDQAERAYLEAQQLAIEHGLTRQHAFCLELMCRLRLKQKHMGEAIEFGVEALATHRRASDPLRVASTLAALGESYKHASRRGDANAAFEEAGEVYGTIETWDDAAESLESAAKLAVENEAECDRLIERGIEAAIRARDAMQVLKLLQVRRPPDSDPPYEETLRRFLSHPVIPHTGLFMTNVALHAGKLSTAKTDVFLHDVIDDLLSRAMEPEGSGFLTGLAAALLNTGSCIPDSWVNTIRDRIQAIEGVYYRGRNDGSGIWTIGLEWEKPAIVQLDMLSEYPSVQRITLALALYLLANGKTIGEYVQRLGGNLEEALRFMLCTEDDFNTHISEGKRIDTYITPENPVAVAESGIPWGERQPPAVVILHDKFSELADISSNIDTMASQLLLAHVTLDFIAHCTHSSRDAVKESLSIVRESFR
jgi:tetratricopeptide (TPR) repeat protein